MKKLSVASIGNLRLLYPDFSNHLKFIGEARCVKKEDSFTMIGLTVERKVLFLEIDSAGLLRSRLSEWKPPFGFKPEGLEEQLIEHYDWTRHTLNQSISEAFIASALKLLEEG